MEGRKKMGSSSSFTSELFGSNQFQKSSASGIFESMFPPPPKQIQFQLFSEFNLCTKETNSEHLRHIAVSSSSLHMDVLGRGSLCSEVSGKSSSEGWNYKFDYISMGNHGETQNTAQKDMSSIYQEQRLQPCQLSSSIHYGGQDIYSCPKSTQDSGYNSLGVPIIKITLAKGYAP
ncbi:hypothetical protein JHK85_051654 [Glycine max]|nr:hypothetical protein JHK85_051654 [Glycine max]